jgi:hypothetical protein
MEDKGMRAWMKSLAVLVALMGPRESRRRVG